MSRWNPSTHHLLILIMICPVANPRTLCLVLQRHRPFGQLAQLGAIVHEGVRDVAALLAVRQLAGNATGSVTVERGAEELLVRVETLQLPPHVARAGAPARARAAAPRAR